MKRFGPLSKDHPAVTEKQLCQACLVAFKAGDMTTLVPLGPGDDAECQARCREGWVYNAVAVHVHWACAMGERV